ncbi:oxidoreductase [Roseomonas nepalensis]|uniref:Oxidoreductase n=1 Tax=Muricoccus nepalensis TaxID=1854500 RepID=A0A502GEH0_9PROT|nr:PDR/VanB family oxidoreductase [Roseomonas nepalensis]TPG60295.1 oxidoreductase [Roseomonas nepalensis]
MPDAPAEGELMALRVARAEPAAEGIHLFELRHPAGGELPPFTPGAHLSVRVPGGALRNYSLCNDPHERDRYVIAVKRDEGGRGGSVALVDGVAMGDALEVSAPRNLFELDPRAPEYLFVAGGIGITPILAMIRYLKATGGKPFRLFYLTRHAAGTAFLADPDLAGEAVVIHHDEGDADQAYDLWPVFEEPTKAHIYCCGPRPLMDAVRDMTGHWPENSVHFEDFGSDLVRPREDDKPFRVRVGREGEALEVPVGATILEVLRLHGHKLPSSCESGTCGTCRTRYVEGEVDHRDLVLTPAERETSLMICVSRAASDELVLEP